MSSDPRPGLTSKRAGAPPAAIKRRRSVPRPILALTALLILLAFSLPTLPSLAQQPPAPTPIVVTATPVPQIIVVTATPSLPPAPKTLWSEYGKTIASALAGLIFGGVLTWLFKPLFERLGKWAADGLGKLGSGWGFRRRYLDLLIEEHRALNIRGLRNLAKVTVELERVYVSLSARPQEARWAERDRQAMGIGPAMDAHRRLVLLGGPGTGKSTLLSYLALTYARGQSLARLGLKEKRLPIHVPLRQLKDILKAENKRLPEYLDQRYAELGLTPRPGFFERALRRGRCLVLLDGLDEVADEGERRAISAWVDRLVTVYPQNRYVVTSRPPGYESAPLKNGFAVLNVRDFDADDVRRFADNWCLAVEISARGEDNPDVRRRARDASRDLVAAIEANAAIRRLAVNPLLLSIVALVHRNRATLPRRRVDLYDECVQVLLGHWDQAKGLASTLTPREKRTLLQPLALEMHLEKRREIGRRELVERMGALLPDVGGTARDAGEFVEEIKERSGLLVEVGLERYGWSHLTFQEYLCARAVFEDPSQQHTLMAQLGDEWWQEVILLYVGMTDATPVVRALLEREVDVDCRHLLLAGRCAAEATRLEQAAREQTMQRLQAQFETCSGQRFLEVGQVLAEIGGEDGVGFFLRVARADAARREAALWALGQMAQQPNETLRERVVAQLVTALQEPELGALALHVLMNALLPDRLFQVCPAEHLAEALDAAVVTVPGGPFLMGDDQQQAQVDAFAIDRYPVTNVQYARFVEATGRKTPRHWTRGAIPEGKALHPVVYVTWHDAAGYARWAGKRLPTEEEWEKAARGADGRVYPWGDEFDAQKCNAAESGVGGTTPVGRYSPGGDSPYGCADMAGNVWEWTTSEHERFKGNRVLRGGSYYSDPRAVRAGARSDLNPDSSYNVVGFRCVSPISPSVF